MTTLRLFALTACLAVSSASAASLTRGPMLQSTTSGSAIVSLRLDAACPVTVEYGPRGGALQSAASPSGTQHAVVLGSLTPGQTYAYTVTACGARVGGEASFQTPRAYASREVHFGVIGDSGTGGSNQVKVVSALQNRIPEMLITVGDN